LNPLKAKIVNTIDELTEYPWTSHNLVMSQKVHSWYDNESVLGLFGKTKHNALTNYLVYLHEGMNENIDLEGGGLIRSKTLGEGMILTKRVNHNQLKDEQILGDNDFITEVLSGKMSDDTNKVNEEQEDKIIQDVIDRVTKKNGVNKEILLNKNISRSAKTARALIAYIGVKKIGMTNEKIAKVLNITSPAICKMLTRNKEEFDTYEDKTIEMIIKN
ncbi:MAG: hypothetical protein ABII23_02965, partial [bacterium]